MYCKKIFVNLLLLSMCVVFSVGTTGCKIVQKIDSLNGILEPPPPDWETDRLLEAEYAYFLGNFVEAGEIYASVRSKSSKPVYKNSALYGQVCISIITAKDNGELEQAFAMLDQWRESDSETAGFQENPRMIAMALNARNELLKCACGTEIRYVATKEEGELAEKYEAEVRELKEIIKKLEHQISVFEAIDQEIQEKRKPL